MDREALVQRAGKCMAQMGRTLIEPPFWHMKIMCSLLLLSGIVLAFFAGVGIWHIEALRPYLIVFYPPFLLITYFLFALVWLRVVIHYSRQNTLERFRTEQRDAARRVCAKWRAEQRLESLTYEEQQRVTMSQLM